MQKQGLERQRVKHHTVSGQRGLVSLRSPRHDPLLQAFFTVSPGFFRGCFALCRYILDFWVHLQVVQVSASQHLMCESACHRAQRYYFGAGYHYGVPEDLQASTQGSEMGDSAGFGLPISSNIFSNI